MPGFYDQDDDENFPYWEQDDSELEFFVLEPPSWFDFDQHSVHHKHVRCEACKFLLAIEDGMCQYCLPKLNASLADTLSGFDKLLTNHLAFAKWSEENEARAA